MTQNLSDREREYIKCASDPLYFLNNYGYVFDAKKQKVLPMTCFEYQEDCIDAYHKYQNNIVLKSRQTGLSAITAGYCAWRLIFRIDQKILIIANDGDGAERFLGTIKQFIFNAPRWMLPGTPEQVLKDDPTNTNNQKKIELYNNSWAKARASSENAGRGESLTMLVLDEAAFIEHINKIWMGAGMALSATQGKCIWISCVPGDTMVFTNKGVKEVSSFVDHNRNGGYEVQPYYVLGKDLIRGGNLFFNNGVHKTKKIFTTSSYLEGTLTHKLWACKNGNYDWYQLKDLDKGDYVAIQYGNEIWGDNDEVSEFKPSKSGYILNKFNPKKITKEIAYLIGLYISEGSVYKKYNDDGEFIGGSVTLTCGDDISQFIENAGLKFSCNDGLHYSIGSKNLIEFLEHIGFDLSKTAKEKIIPERLMEMSRNNIIHMLRGIFDGDGYSRKDRGYIGISMNSKRLIEQIRMLLLNFGVLTDYNEVWTKPTRKVKIKTLNYRISANARYSKVFYKKIGFNFKRKQLNENVLSKYNLNRNNPNDVIPFYKNILIDFINKCGLSRHKLRKSGIRITDKKTEHVSRGLAFQVLDFCREIISDEDKKVFSKAVDNNIKTA